MKTLGGKLRFTAFVLLLLLLTISFLYPSFCRAQSQPKITIPAPVKITAGLTYQVLLIANGGRGSLTIQNNQAATDNCQLIVGGPWQAGDTTATSRTINGVSMTASQASIMLFPGGSYTRYYPYVPSDQILGTCATTGDALYVDTQ